MKHLPWLIGLGLTLAVIAGAGAIWILLVLAGQD
jgi:hypothetical protein